MRKPFLKDKEADRDQKKAKEEGKEGKDKTEPEEMKTPQRQIDLAEGTTQKKRPVSS